MVENEFVNNTEIFNCQIGDYSFDLYIDNTFLSTPITEKLSPEHYKTIHNHMVYELFFVLDEEMEITTHQKMLIKNSLVIIPPSVYHYCVSKNSYRFFLNVDHLNTNTKKRLFDNNPCFNQNDITITKFSQNVPFYLSEISKTLVADLVSRQNKIKSFLTLLLCEIFNFDKQIDEEKQSQIQNYSTLIESIINNEYATTDITLEYVANRLHLCTKQTQRVIKKIFNNKLSALVINKKLHVAAMLLQNTNQSIAKIIETVNFNTPCYFYTEFKKKYKLTPLQYRNTPHTQNINKRQTKFYN